MRVVELMGAPCSGKSTVAMGLVYMLRQEGYKAELVTEVAKDFYWERILSSVSQEYITRSQIAKIKAVASHSGLDFIICDSAIAAGVVYATKERERKAVCEMISKFYSKVTTEMFLIDCDLDYTTTGRLQDETEARLLKEQLGDAASQYSGLTRLWGIQPKEAVRLIMNILQGGL